MWTIKLVVCIVYDLLDFTLGRALFPIPFLGEIIGCGLCCMMFGRAGMFYGLEAIDMTEQIDGFIPTATIIVSTPASTNQSTQTTAVTKSAEVTVAIASSPTSVDAGSALDYNLTVTNAGPSTASTLSVTTAGNTPPVSR